MPRATDSPALRQFDCSSTVDIAAVTGSCSCSAHVCATDYLTASCCITNIKAVRMSVIQPSTLTDCQLHHVSTSCGQLYGLTKGITTVLHRTAQATLAPNTYVRLTDHTNTTLLLRIITTTLPP